jgi:hypothetical protein
MFVRSLFMETCEIKILQMRRSLGIKEIYAPYIKTAESYITQMLKQYLNLKAGLISLVHIVLPPEVYQCLYLLEF